MVIRVYTAQIAPRHEGEYHALLRPEFARLCQTPGVDHAHIGRQVVDGIVRVVTVTTWHDVDAMRAVMGDDISRPIRSDLLAPFILDEHVELYETLDMDSPPWALQTQPALARGA